ncbi:DUF1667 domain-containing protein [Candidatus Poribacteria bacterium]|nr:DUF1667 domain-containing protein [Candidatus Poribacteria bacterium]
MIKKLTCIECPKGCILSTTIENSRAINVEGNLCEKGKKYAELEVENPVRTFTSTVLAHGLSLKMIPVRTDKPIAKIKIFDAMNEIKKIIITRPVYTGEILAENFLNLNANLISTREVS